MIATAKPNTERYEDLIAELTIAAYDVTLKYHTGKASLFESEDSFIDAELALWAALRRVLDNWMFSEPAAAASNKRQPVVTSLGVSFARPGTAA
ncbi:MAG: hypothetical protein K1X74_06435 [Pirellulales bacterium]|nr:hypothetical protein [Pirellulales bacterium]